MSIEYRLYRGYIIRTGTEGIPGYSGRVLAYSSMESANMNTPLIAADSDDEAVTWIDNRVLSGDYGLGEATLWDIDSLNGMARIKWANRQELQDVISKAITRYGEMEAQFLQGLITPKDFAVAVEAVWTEANYNISVLE